MRTARLFIAYAWALGFLLTVLWTAITFGASLLNIPTEVYRLAPIVEGIGVLIFGGYVLLSFVR